jgi:hypothetical protein
VEEEEREVEFIEDVEKREKRFKELVAKIYTEAEAISEIESPLSQAHHEYLFVVAVFTGKVFSFSSPGLQPMIATEEGKKLITTLLETNLKTMAEEADPVAQAREEAAIQRALQKELNDEK